MRGLGWGALTDAFFPRGGRRWRTVGGGGRFVAATSGRRVPLPLDSTAAAGAVSSVLRAWLALGVRFGLVLVLVFFIPAMAAGISKRAARWRMPFAGFMRPD